MSEAAIPPEAEREWEACFPITADTARSLQRNTEQMGVYLAQMGQMLVMMQKRMDELEARQQAVTLSHEDVKGVQQLIRNRAHEYCEQYEILAPGCLRSVSAGIRRAVLARYGVKDLHDVPAIARQAVEAQISRWSDIRLAMKCREKLRDGGA